MRGEGIGRKGKEKRWIIYKVQRKMERKNEEMRKGDRGKMEKEN